MGGKGLGEAVLDGTISNWLHSDHRTQNLVVPARRTGRGTEIVGAKKGQGKPIRRLALTSILKQNTAVFRPPVSIVKIVSARASAAL